MTREGSTRDSGETAQQARSEGREPDREAARPTSVSMTQDTPSIAASPLTPTDLEALADFGLRVRTALQEQSK